MSRAFVHHAVSARVVFGAGARARLPEEADRLGLRALLVVCTPGHADVAAEVASTLGERVADVHPDAAMHVPAAVAAKAVARADALGADGCLAVGGGSAIGLAKAIAKDTGLPIIALPTTYAGSEMTSVWGVTDAGCKTTGRDPRVRPVTVVYDPELTVTLPPAASITSGINAIAHSAEALYAPDGSPLTALVAAESVQALHRALPLLATNPTAVDARADALYGAWLAGTTLESTTMSLHHKLCHVLGGMFDLPHGPTHTAVLPHVLAVNLRAAPQAHAMLADALGAPDPAAEMFGFAARLGAQMALADLGLPADGLDAVIAQVLAAPYANPVPVTAAVLRDIVQHALLGVAPKS